MLKLFSHSTLPIYRYLDKLTLLTIEDTVMVTVTLKVMITLSPTQLYTGTGINWLHCSSKSELWLLCSSRTQLRASHDSSRTLARKPINALAACATQILRPSILHRITFIVDIQSILQYINTLHSLYVLVLKVLPFLNLLTANKIVATHLEFNVNFENLFVQYRY